MLKRATNVDQQSPWYVPDMPTADAITPYLKQIDTNRWYTNYGALVQSLESLLLEKFFESKGELIPTSSGTTALEISLKSLGLPQNTPILVPSFTFPATISAIISAGYTPLFCDIARDSLALDVEKARAACAMRKDIGAIVVVCPYGRPINNEEWVDLKSAQNIPVIVDAAAAMGLQGCIDKLIYCFSMHATKPFGVGEGGLIWTGSKSKASTLRKMTNFGLDEGQVTHSGINAKLSEYHAAVGLAQLDRWAGPVPRLSSLRTWFDCLSQNHAVQFAQPWVSIHERACLPMHILVSCSNTRSQLIKKFRERFIGFKTSYLPPTHAHPALSPHYVNTGLSDLEVTLEVADRLVPLPHHNFLNNKDLNFVASAIEQCLGS
jgi:dTDP-4-amino-4,6-dideoxygalactose transaminase